MKNILLIEDNGLMSNELSVNLEKKTYQVELAYSYESALDRWDEFHGNFDCIIIDLNINPRGMFITDVVDYQPFYGMAVYDYFIKYLRKSSTKQTQEPADKYFEMLKSSLEHKVVLYSGFISSFKQRCRERKEWNAAYRNLAQIDKNDRDSIKRLMNKVDSICHE